jgi:hypothetical protein
MTVGEFGYRHSLTGKAFPLPGPTNVAGFPALQTARHFCNAALHLPGFIPLRRQVLLKSVQLSAKAISGVCARTNSPITTRRIHFITALRQLHSETGK